LALHGHFRVNGHKVNIPSYLVKTGDVISVCEGSRKVVKINEALAKVDRSPRPVWLELDKDGFQGKVTALPGRSDVAADIDEQLIVELYSK
jgi:small subunit ribosomal protein S4